MYKNRAPIHCRHIWVDMTLYNNPYVYVARSHSMSVDLRSHFTPQKIFNKSKKGKNIRTEELCLSSLKLSPHWKLIPTFLRVH